MTEQLPDSNEQLESPETSEQARLDTLCTELQNLIESGAPESEQRVKADQINQLAADLYEMGEMNDDEAWAVSVGDNPYIHALEDPFFEE